MKIGKRQKGKIFVGLSGGVDSSVAALLLKKQGFDVTGVYIKGWYPDWKECSWKENRRDAMRVSAQLNIPFKTLDLSEEYKRDVVDYFLSEYKNGRTPNPDVMCNKHIKFGSFYDWAIEQGANYVATGHYARIHNNILERGTDKSKDQSYFLWALEKEKLKNIIFPLGELHKSRVRQIAYKYNLATSNKKDSQGICFLEDVSMEEFLKHYFPEKIGPVLDEKGVKIGTHNGVVLFTLGQRHGFQTYKTSSEEKPYFVVAKDFEKNTITVSHARLKTKNKEFFILQDVNWILSPDTEKIYTAQSRYRQKPSKCSITRENNIWKAQYVEQAEYPVAGQSLVVYDQDQCLGGGIVS